jgi:hypothetical protein
MDSSGPPLDPLWTEPHLLDCDTNVADMAALYIGPETGTTTQVLMCPKRTMVLQTVPLNERVHRISEYNDQTETIGGKRVYTQAPRLHPRATLLLVIGLSSTMLHMIRLCCTLLLVTGLVSNNCLQVTPPPPLGPSHTLTQTPTPPNNVSDVCLSTVAGLQRLLLSISGRLCAWSNS